MLSSQGFGHLQYALIWRLRLYLRTGHELTLEQTQTQKSVSASSLLMEPGSAYNGP